jgi:hypothetical protein
VGVMGDPPGVVIAALWNLPGWLNTKQAVARVSK